LSNVISALLGFDAQSNGSERRKFPRFLDLRTQEDAAGEMSAGFPAQIRLAN
jgi:hypothetical protein